MKQIILVFSLLFALQQNKLIEIPIEKVQMPVPKELKSLRASPVSNMIDIGNQRYCGWMDFGTPAQKIFTLFDTGSTILWTFTTKCKSDECQQIVSNGKKLFDTSKSSTFKQESTPWDLRQGDGSEEISGKQATDSVGIEGAQASSVTLGAMTDSNIPSNFAAIAGLGWPSSPCEGCPTLPSIVQTLFKGGQLDENSFSMQLSSSENGSSRLFLGGDHTAYYKGSMVSTPVLHADSWPWWTVMFDGIGVENGEYVKNSVGQATIVDSGTPGWVVPDDMFTAAGFDKINVENDCSNKDELPTVQITMAGKKHPMTPSSYVLEVNENAGMKTCQMAIMKSGGIKSPTGLYLGILGDVFMRLHYTKFDQENEKVWFAEAIIH